MIYELRVYEVHPGKMQAVQDRFRDHVIQLFKKHDMNIVQFWEDLEPGNNRLYYLVEHTDLETRHVNYDRFNKDPEWHQVKRMTEVDGPIVKKHESFFMHNVAFFENK